MVLNLYFGMHQVRKRELIRAIKKRGKSISKTKIPALSKKLQDSKPMINPELPMKLKNGEKGYDGLGLANLPRV